MREVPVRQYQGDRISKQDHGVLDFLKGKEIKYIESLKRELERLSRSGSDRRKYETVREFLADASIGMREYSGR